MNASNGHPPPHAKYIVLRKGFIFTATPCYGMHEPWWVVKTMEGEADPVGMLPDDEWWPLDKFMDSMRFQRTLMIPG